MFKKYDFELCFFFNTALKLKQKLTFTLFDNYETLRINNFDSLSHNNYYFSAHSIFSSLMNFKAIVF